MLLLFVVAGTAYVYITDREGPPAPVKSTAVSTEASPLPPPKKPAANAPEGVSVVSLLSPVPAGSNTSMAVSTNASSTCTVSVSYNGVKSTDSGLAPQIANAYGSAQWTWTVDPSAPAGSWPIVVTCTYNGRTGVVDTSIQVTKS